MARTLTWTATTTHNKTMAIPTQHAALSTYFGLLAEFGASEIPLEAVAPKYFGLEASKAKRLAATQQLPIAVYRAGSQKSPWLVSAQVLSDYLDQRKRQAGEEWRRMNQ